MGNLFKGHTIVYYFSLIIISVLVSGCESENINKLPIEIKYEILNSEGRVVDKLKEGENFIISFSIINYSSETLVYHRNHEDNPDFAQVFRLDEQENSLIPLGKPFSPKRYPTTLKVAVLWLLPYSGINVNFPWVYDSTMYDLSYAGDYEIHRSPYNLLFLDKGKYEIHFTEMFDITKKGNRLPIDPLTFRKQFIIY